jgi:hypothetical protein
MPSEFPRSPKLLKGALVVFASQKPGPQPTVIAFQYNPEQLSRSLATRATPCEPSNVGATREDVLRVLGPPGETINLSVELDATEQPDKTHAQRYLLGSPSQGRGQVLRQGAEKKQREINRP